VKNGWYNLAKSKEGHGSEIAVLPMMTTRCVMHIISFMCVLSFCICTRKWFLWMVTEHGSKGLLTVLCFSSVLLSGLKLVWHVKYFFVLLSCVKLV
jgi:hypothetical protein